MPSLRVMASLKKLNREWSNVRLKEAFAEPS